MEQVLLEIRLSEGIPMAMLTASERHRARGAVEAGLLRDHGERVVLTARGRLLADAVVRDLLDD
jgi:oxygen-independent coproporphyrinogen-3 oxidase